MAELAITSYRQTYFAAGQYARHGVALASVRAGNVIGGGDFADFRLVPDCMRALTVGEPIRLRIPENVRPWQHVLEPLSGYLWLAVQLLQQGPAFAEAWNFGPLEQQSVTAQAIAEKLITLWGSGSWVRVCPAADKVEARELRLSWDKVASRLRWRPVYTWEEALAEIVDWCKAFQQSQDMYQVCRDHIGAYCRRARELGLGWAVSVLSVCHQSDAVSSMTALAQC
jgi:CDP-glucose 4,6-dehydratase